MIKRLYLKKIILLLAISVLFIGVFSQYVHSTSIYNIDELKKQIEKWQLVDNVEILATDMKTFENEKIYVIMYQAELEVGLACFRSMMLFPNRCIYESGTYGCKKGRVFEHVSGYDDIEYCVLAGTDLKEDVDLYLLKTNDFISSKERELELEAIQDSGRLLWIYVGTTKG